MQQLARLARIFSSPTVLIVTVWSVLLIVIAIGPIDYGNQPSAAVLALVVIGISLFILAQQAGVWCFRVWLVNHAGGPAPRADRLSLVVGISSCAGIAGIGLIALDRVVLSGVSNGVYAELLRCAPDLIDIVEIKRTSLLYLGYLLFSFGFASLVLFLLKGEQIRGWAAVLAQLSILSPVGYALLYAGRMPILFVILLTIAAVLVRLTQGRRALPEGHHLFIKMVVLVMVFVLYSSAIWLEPTNLLHADERTGSGIAATNAERGGRAGQGPRGAAGRYRRAAPGSRVRSGAAIFDVIVVAPVSRRGAPGTRHRGRQSRRWRGATRGQIVTVQAEHGARQTPSAPPISAR